MKPLKELINKMADYEILYGDIAKFSSSHTALERMFFDAGAAWATGRALKILEEDGFCSCECHDKNFTKFHTESGMCLTCKCKQKEIQGLLIPEDIYKGMVDLARAGDGKIEIAAPGYIKIDEVIAMIKKFTVMTDHGWRIQYEKVIKILTSLVVDEENNDQNQ